jgi:RimJ/RimL family protein N-acetyltransferase
LDRQRQGGCFLRRGKGLASEMIQGLVAWCRRSNVTSIVGGVARGNVSSCRVLEKNGFTCDPGTEDAEEQMFELRLR